MPVAFGFSVGDFIAALELVGTVINALRNSSKSGASFRSLINELYALETALLRVKRLNIKDYSTVKVTALYQAALQCQNTIDAFWKKTQKYQPHLQGGGTSSKVKDAWYKIKWALCKIEDVETFRAEIRGHISSLEILLLSIQLEATQIDRRLRDSNCKSLAGMIQRLTCNAMERRKSTLSIHPIWL
jgi:Fungal N-terminal domain of STAND proteins